MVGANQIPGRVTGDHHDASAVVEVAEYRRSPVTVKDSVTSASPVVKEFRSKSHCCVFAIHRGTWRANDPCPILPRMDNILRLLYEHARREMHDARGGEGGWDEGEGRGEGRKINNAREEEGRKDRSFFFFSLFFFSLSFFFFRRAR